MTEIIDMDLYEWLDNDKPLEDTELRLKKDAPETIIKKFEDWKQKREKLRVEGWEV